MDELIRRALAGDKQAQKACTEKGIAIPCPCCGGAAIVSKHPEYGWRQYEVSCEECFLSFNKTFFTEKEAIEDWNARVAPPIGRCGECANTSTIDPESLPIVQELKEQLTKVTAERDALKMNPSVKVDSDAFELALQLSEAKAKLAGSRPDMRGEWKYDEFGCYCTACHEYALQDDGEAIETAYCPECGARMKGV